MSAYIETHVKRTAEANFGSLGIPLRNLRRLIEDAELLQFSDGDLVQIKRDVRDEDTGRLVLERTEKTVERVEPAAEEAQPEEREL